MPFGSTQLQRREQFAVAFREYTGAQQWFNGETDNVNYQSVNTDAFTHRYLINTGAFPEMPSRDRVAEVNHVHPAATFTHVLSLPGINKEHAEIWRLYYAYFDRAPDAAGALYWMTQFEANCAAVVDISYGFFQSTEFQQTYGNLSNRAFVELIYRNVLNRAPDTAGFAYWLNLLNSGQLTHQGLVEQFAWAPEFIRSHPMGRADNIEHNGCGTYIR